MLLAYIISIMRFVFVYIGLFVRVLEKKSLVRFVSLFSLKGAVLPEKIFT